MSYKSLLTTLTDPATAKETLNSLITLAQAWDAHADALCLGVDRTQPGYYYAGANALIIQETLARAREEADEILAVAKGTFSNASVRWAAEAEVTPIADLGRHVSLRARFSDLVVLPQPYGEGRGMELEPMVEAALFEGHAPVLVLPDETPVKARPRRIVAAWNQSVEALNAIRAALPLMKEAELVRVTVIDPQRHGVERSDPGGLLSQMLARHGISCEVDVMTKTMPRVSDVLNRHVVDTDSDLVVMGAYGHARFREAILGGATRHMLEQAKVPVLMAH